MEQQDRPSQPGVDENSIEPGTALPNLFAAVSGSKASGYLSGNGLLTAVAYGYLAGRAAAELTRHGSR